MKTCAQCGLAHDPLACACQACGPTIWLTSEADLHSMVEARRRQQTSADHVDRGVSYIREKQLARAKEEIQKSQEINPLNPVAWSNYGYVLLLEGKSREAIPYLEKALSLNPKLEGVAAALDRARRVLQARP